MFERAHLSCVLRDHAIALELLDALIEKRRSDDIDLAEGKLELPIGAGDLALALLIDEMLSPFCSSLADLISSGKVLKVDCLEEDMADRVKALLFSGLEAARRLMVGSEETAEGRSWIVATIPGRGYDKLLREVLNKAFAQRALVIAIVTQYAEERPTKVISFAADASLPMPSISERIVGKVFEAAFRTIPSEGPFLSEDAGLDLDAVDGIFRPGREAETCMAALKGSRDNVPEPPPPSADRLETAHGYGEAKVWGLSLIQDYALWQAGAVEWEDVPERCLLLSGRPGTGKSTFPALLANSLGVTLTVTSVADWNSRPYLSGTLQAMDEVFEKAVHEGGVLFLDELDGISRRDREEERHRSYWDQVVNKLLTWVSRASEVPGLVIIGATNFPDRIDPALLRSGRMERHIRIELPDAAGRAEIIRHYAGPVLSEAELGALSRMSVHHSGADLRKLVRYAKAEARRSREPFGFEVIARELGRPLKELGSDDQRRVFVYGQGRSLVCEVLGITLGRTSAYPTLAHLRDQMVALMAGRAAEEIILGEASTIGEMDLDHATRMAVAIETRFGLGGVGLLAEIEGARSATLARGHIEEAAMRAATLLLQNLPELERRLAGKLEWHQETSPMPHFTLH